MYQTQNIDIIIKKPAGWQAHIFSVRLFTMPLPAYPQVCGPSPSLQHRTAADIVPFFS